MSVTSVCGNSVDDRQKRPEFFKNHRVDYPNPSVSRSSRKFVKGLKSLSGTLRVSIPVDKR